VLHDVQPRDFFLAAHTQTENRLDEEERKRNRDRRPCADAQHTQQLQTQQLEAAAVEQTSQHPFGIIRRCARRQQTNRQRAPDAVEEMHSNRADRIIHMQLVVQEPHAEVDNQTGDNADDDGTRAVQHVAARRDADQTRQRGVQAHRHIRLAVMYPSENHADNCCHGRRNRRRQENRAEGFDALCRRAVEAVPAEPQDEHAEAAQRNVMTGERIHADNLAALILGELADARANHLCANQRAQTADHVNRARTGVVMEAQLCQPAAAPNPVCLDGVNQRGNDGGIHAVGEELRALCHCAGDDGRRRRAENEVEDKVREIEIRVRGENVKTGLADKAHQVFAQQKREANQDEHHCADAEVHQVLHQDVARVLRAGEAGFDHCEACLHPENERRAD